MYDIVLLQKFLVVIQISMVESVIMSQIKDFNLYFYVSQYHVSCKISSYN